VSRPITIAAWLAMAAGLVALGGCGPAAAKQADPEAARQALRQALESWKKGEAPDSLKSASPPVVVVDRDWRRGAKLLDYELSETPAPNGFDQQFTVSITLEDAGRKKSQKVAFNVATHPKRVVVRAEGS
jgi:hypothetical protein